jgi:hypothetical protein
MFELQFFCQDGCIEDHVREGYFDTIEEVYDRINNIGSRWIFYPNARIIKEGEIIEEFMA